MRYITLYSPVLTGMSSDRRAPVRPRSGQGSLRDRDFCHGAPASVHLLGFAMLIPQHAYSSGCQHARTLCRLLRHPQARWPVFPRAFARRIVSSGSPSTASSVGVLRVFGP